MSSLREFIHLIWEASFHNPLLFIFLVSALSNAIPFATLPYLVIVTILSKRISSDLLTQLLVVLSSGTGAALGKIFVYLIGRVARSRVSRDTRENLDYLSSRIGFYGFLLILLAASTPIPDDVINLPAGFAGYNLLHYIAAVLIGKIIITGATVYLGVALLDALETVGLNLFYSSIILLVLSIYISYLLATINWRYVLEDQEPVQSTREKIYRVASRFLREVSRVSKKVFSRNIIARKIISAASS